MTSRHATKQSPVERRKGESVRKILDIPDTHVLKQALGAQ